MTAADVVLLAARSIVAVVLLAAGAAKLADRASFARTLAALGVAPRLARPAAVAIAGGEVLVALASLASAWMRPVDVAVVVITWSFVVVSIAAMVRSPDVECRCFGALGASTFDARSVTRAVVLATVSTAVLWGDSTAGAIVRTHIVSSVLVVMVAAVFAVASLQAARALEVIRRSRTT